MNKYIIRVPLDYVQGHLRSGDKVLYAIEAASEEEALELARREEDYDEIDVSDYRIEDYGSEMWDEAYVSETIKPEEK